MWNVIQSAIRQYHEVSYLLTFVTFLQNPNDWIQTKDWTWTYSNNSQIKALD